VSGGHAAAEHPWSTHDAVTLVAIRSGQTAAAAMGARLGRGDVAARDGDFDALVALLDPDVVLRVDFGKAGPSRLIRGAAAVAGQALVFSRTGPIPRPVTINGAPGLITMPDGNRPRYSAHHPRRQGSSRSTSGRPRAHRPTRPARPRVSPAPPPEMSSGGITEVLQVARTVWCAVP
jgi:hypothetical protein